MNPPRLGADLTESQSTDLWREVFKLADEALELEGAEQRAFVDRCLEKNPAVGAELRSIIEGAGAASALETSAAAFAAPFIDKDAENQTAGRPGGDPTMFGPYRVSREVGRGGMGAVYLAERSDDQYKKEVAVKVLPPWRLGDRRGLQRFLEERQILAALDHPGIARLLDGGITTGGMPWFAMEYIDGQPIDRYCDDVRLSIDRRLKLFCDVCSAVQYAHQNLVVHRDLKPSNILVSADGRVALLDFGIARLLAEDPAALAAATATGDRLLTPLYASPEQMRGEPASTAVDVYALGVLLHVLVTGNHPYRLASFGSYEISRAVLWQEPERSSLSAVSEGGPSVSGAAHRTAEDRALARGTTPVKLARRLRGDLDAIVLKAMDKEAGRRYATAEQLETDVRRYLARLPVLAQPPGHLYVARKFVRRHRAGVAITAAAVILVVSFAAVMTVQRSRIRAQAERIAVERDLAEQNAAFLFNTFRSVTPGDSGVTARDILDSATAQIDQRLIAHPEQRARHIFEMARAYYRLELNDRARGLLETSLALRRALRPRADVQVAEVQDLLGAVLLAQGRTGPAEQAYNEALALRRRELGSRHADVARTLVGLADVLREQRRFPKAEGLAREAIAIDQARGDVGRFHLAQSLASLARVLADEGDHRAAAEQFRRALALVRETHSEEDPEVVRALVDLASAHHGAGDRKTGDSLILYGLVLQRRLLTSGLLKGTSGFSSAPGARTPAEIAAPVERALSAQSPASGSLAPAAAGSQIVFVSDRDGPDPGGNRGNQEIYIMNADGSGQRRLTHEKAADASGTLSPDGRRIAFTSQRGGGFDIFVMNRDGTAQKRLTNFTARGFGAAEAAWSPDGKRIAFRTFAKQIDLYLINVDGTGLTQLTNDAPAQRMPAWSPDGKRIAFTGRGDGGTDIFAMGADGRNVVRLTYNRATDRAPAWSPDGRRIAFESDRDGNFEVYVMDADGNSPVRLTRNPSEDGRPSWSPDGRHIVFQRQVLGHGQVHVMNADGSEVRRLTELSTVSFSGFPKWGWAPR